VDVRSGGHTRNRAAKDQKRDRLGAQKLNQSATLNAVGMQINVHAVAMIQSPARVQIGLSKRRKRQRAVELADEKLFDFAGIGKSPAAAAFGWFGSSVVAG
jgi:hypothetical protein